MASGARAIVIIPARLGSTRFPGKVLADATGKPLIQHVCESASRAPSVRRVVVATDDQRVLETVTRFGGEAVMTSPDHPNGSSRLAEACDALGLDDEEIVVNVQGDEPEIEELVIDRAVETLEQAGTPVATCAVPLTDASEARSPHVVKVVARVDGRALYFSRALIPHDRDGEAGVPAGPLRHVGLYAYRRSFLREYAEMGSTPLEATEKLEQLRILEHGHDIAVAVVQGVRAPAGIDTPEQYEAFVRRAGA